ncbi:hypothetical protein M758_UG026800 [Ceratodon purpureus]|nr:hypothetical protein M758_UG026800 [Ceratodon purpureus]
MKWVQCGPGDFTGDLPSDRSGHSAVRVKGNRVVVFGGLYEKKFLHDLHVLDIGVLSIPAGPLCNRI